MQSGVKILILYKSLKLNKRFYKNETIFCTVLTVLVQGIITHFNEMIVMLQACPALIIRKPCHQCVVRFLALGESNHNGQP